MLMLAAGAHADHKDQSRILPSPDAADVLIDPPYSDDVDSDTKDQSRVTRPPAPPRPPDLVSPRPRESSERDAGIQAPAESTEKTVPEKTVPQMTGEAAGRRKPAG